MFKIGAVINETERRGGVGNAAASYSEDREFISGFGAGYHEDCRGIPPTFRVHTVIVT